MYFVGETTSFEGLASLKAKRKRELEDYQIQQQKLLLLKQQQDKQSATKKPKEKKCKRQEKCAAPSSPSSSSPPPPTISGGEYDQPSTTTSSVSSDLPEVKKLEETDKRIQEGLAILVEAAKERTELIKENFERNSSFSEKDDKFSGISNHIYKISASSLGNQIYRVAKRAEIDSAIAELDVKNKCFLVFDEEKCIEFINEHKTVLLQIAFQTFSRNLSIYSKKTQTKVVKVVKSDYANNCNKLTFVTRDENEKQKLIGGRGIIDENGEETENKIVREFTTRGVHPSVMTRILMKKVADDEDEEEQHIRPEERVSLDLTHSAASYVFSTLRRLDKKQPVYYALGTLWQKKYHKTNTKKYRMVEVVGWDEDIGSKKATAKVCGIGNKQNILFLPHSFQQLASKLLSSYRRLLVKNARDKRCPSKLRERAINPQLDNPLEYAEVHKVIDDTLDVMLSMSPESVFANSTVTNYRRKFKRYTLFCFAMYIINNCNHGNAVSPLSYNFFNFFSYLYANGPDVYASSYISIMNFLYIHLFNLVSSAAPAVSVKRLLDIDSTVLKGGKASIRDFGSPVKTSIHTRTMVSFLGLTENMLRLNMSILRETGIDPNNKYLKKSALSLERWCDAILFVFFTFVLFHRFSMVKKINLEECLRLVLGQAHLHVNKARASKLVRMAKAGSLFAKYTVDEHVVCFKTDMDMGGECCDKQEEEEKETKKPSGNLAPSTVSHPHLLGLPFAIQRALGLPIDHLSPLVALGHANTANTGECTIDKTKVVESAFAECVSLLKFGINIPNIPGPPSNGGAIASIDMFENLVSDAFDRFYGKNSFVSIVNATKKSMEMTEPMPNGRLSADLGAARGIIKIGGEEEEEDYCDDGNNCSFDIARGVQDYFKASPMRLVFTVITDVEGRERVMSIGDMALLAIWIKVRVLKLDWQSNAINISNNKFLSTDLCSQLLLTDLANFGVLGDSKILNKLDCNTNTMHKDGIKPPTEAEQFNFLKMTPLQDRKVAASLHGHVNARTRTHLGRVTSASWAIDALCTLTKGDSAVFGRLVNHLDLFHLGHTNNANLVPYYSKYFKSNEKENGLWGYIKRTSEVAAKEQGLDPVAFQNENDLGEVQAVLDVVAKRKFVGHANKSSCSRDMNVERSKMKERALLRAMGSEAAAAAASKSAFKMKSLWKFPDLVERLLKGYAASVVCPATGFLNVAVHDYILKYDFLKDTNCVKMSLRLLGDRDTKQKKLSMYDIEMNETNKRKLEDNVVVTFSNKITKYDRLGLSDSKEVRDRLKEKDKQCRIASGIKKVLACPVEGDSGSNDISTEKIMKQANKLAFVLRD